MDVATIAFLVLLGGTPAEHIIAMPSMDDCRRAAESISSYQCLTADEFDARINNVTNIQSDFAPASGPSTDPVTNSNGEPEMKAMEGTPSALKRQVRRALDPQPEHRKTIYPGKRGVNEQGNARIIVALNR